MRDLKQFNCYYCCRNRPFGSWYSTHIIGGKNCEDRGCFPCWPTGPGKVTGLYIISRILSQTLCKNNFGSRSLAYELMINNPAIGNLIRDKKVSQIYSQLQTGGKDGMVTLEQCLYSLINEGKISREEAFSKTSIPKALSSLLDGN